MIWGSVEGSGTVPHPPMPPSLRWGQRGHLSTSPQGGEDDRWGKLRGSKPCSFILAVGPPTCSASGSPSEKSRSDSPPTSRGVCEDAGVGPQKAFRMALLKEKAQRGCSHKQAQDSPGRQASLALGQLS